MNLDTSRIEKWPVISWAIEHPRLAAWIVLATGMVVMIVYAARDVGLEASQWVALIVATVLVAGACVWIISWEDADELEDDESLPGAMKSDASATEAVVTTQVEDSSAEEESAEESADADDDGEEDDEAAAAVVATADDDSDDSDDSNADDSDGDDSDDSD
ncbi:MAG: hypothetical protein D6737_06845 [Chloroflexi bacterium]|nr:MAG: hypothetical protein D6737_06845 [Chloroflexota bacterium]